MLFETTPAVARSHGERTERGTIISYNELSRFSQIDRRKTRARRSTGSWHNGRCMIGNERPTRPAGSRSPRTRCRSFEARSWGFHRMMKRAAEVSQPEVIATTLRNARTATGMIGAPSIRWGELFRARCAILKSRSGGRRRFICLRIDLWLSY